MFQIEHLYCSIFDQVFKHLYYKIVDCGDGTLIDGRGYIQKSKEIIQSDPDTIFMLDWYCNGIIELTCGRDVIERYDVNKALLNNCEIISDAIIDELGF